MKIKYFFITAFILSASVSNAQSVEEIMRLSSSSGGLSTSRVISMGGAFTSLGADAGSIDLNPAGLGMYKSSDYSITVGTNTVTTTMNSFSKENTSSGIISSKLSGTTFNLGNLAALFNLNLSDHGLKSITFGVSYNRSADFYMQSYSESAASYGTISDYFSRQLDGINPKNIDNGGKISYDVYNNNSIDLWGAIMNFNNLMIDGTIAAPYKYSINPKNLGDNDFVIPQQTITRKGNTGNFSFSMGFNVDEWLYLGFTMGANSFYYTQGTLYQEWAEKNNTGDFNELYYNRNLTMQGTAFDFKLGATIQPVTGLRIGLAYHAPRTSLINEGYSEYQDISYLGESKRHQQETPFAINDYKIVSSQKLLTGISYRLGSFGIISFDFMRNLNNSVKIKNTGGAMDLTTAIQTSVKDNNEYKVGLELKVYRGLFLRGGFNYIESFYDYENKGDKYGSIRNISAGLGYKGRSFYIDLAYQNSRTFIEPYYYYGMEGLTSESVIDGSVVNNIVTMTLGFKF